MESRRRLSRCEQLRVGMTMLTLGTGAVSGIKVEYQTIDTLAARDLNAPCECSMTLIPSSPLPKLRKHVETKSPFSGRISLPVDVSMNFLKKHQDERGYFMEVLRLSCIEPKGFQPAQLSISETRSGVIKAFHYHEKQSDLFCPLTGSFRIVLFDMRSKSSTCGNGYSIYSDVRSPFLLHIPPGVAHGYQVLGDAAGVMLYVMNRIYDPADEGRFEWNDPTVAFPW